VYAAVAADDPNHPLAAEALSRLLAEPLVTHNYVVVESVALVHTRFGHAAARRLAGDLLPAFELIWVDQALHEAATSAFMAAGSSTVSFVDRVSFELMRRERIDTAFAFDRDFAREGFRLVPST
jgi:predicted nucleic acid-binding protein